MFLATRTPNNLKMIANIGQCYQYLGKMVLYFNNYYIIKGQQISARNISFKLCQCRNNDYCVEYNLMVI